MFRCAQGQGCKSLTVWANQKSYSFCIGISAVGTVGCIVYRHGKRAGHPTVRALLLTDGVLYVKLAHNEVRVKVQIHTTPVWAKQAADAFAATQRELAELDLSVCL